MLNQLWMERMLSLVKLQVLFVGLVRMVQQTDHSSRFFFSSSYLLSFFFFNIYYIVLYCIVLYTQQTEAEGSKSLLLLMVVVVSCFSIVVIVFILSILWLLLLFSLFFRWSLFLLFFKCLFWSPRLSSALHSLFSKPCLFCLISHHPKNLNASRVSNLLVVIFPLHPSFLITHHHEVVDNHH